MADPIAILDAKARELYEAWVASDEGKRAAWNPFLGQRIKPQPWDKLDNNIRECWRGRALTAMRSKETLADELRREDRERRALIPTLPHGTEANNG